MEQALNKLEKSTLLHPGAHGPRFAHVPHVLVVGLLSGFTESFRRHFIVSMVLHHLNCKNNASYDLDFIRVDLHFSASGLTGSGGRETTECTTSMFFVAQEGHL